MPRTIEIRVELPGARGAAAVGLAVLALGGAVAWAAAIWPYTPPAFRAGDPLSAAQMTAEFQQIADNLNELDGRVEGLAQAPELVYGTYTPTWTSLRGFPFQNGTLEGHYTRVGDLVTVYIDLGVLTYATGVNEGSVDLPPGLPRGSVRINGTFSSDWYRNADQSTLGLVAASDDMSKARIQINGVLPQHTSYASAWCSFTYVVAPP